MSLKTYYPELDQTKPIARLEALQGHSGKYTIKTPDTLKSMQGLTLECVLTSEELTTSAQHKTGWNQYRATPAAFKKICCEYSVVLPILLD